MLEAGGYEVVESFKESIVNKLVEEFDLSGSLFKNVVNDVLDHAFCNLHIVVEVCKSHFGNDYLIDSDGVWWKIGFTVVCFDGSEIYYTDRLALISELEDDYSLNTEEEKFLNFLKKLW